MDFTDQSGKTVPNAFETDSKGQLVNRPLLGWTTANVSGGVVLLRLSYAETAAEMKNGDARTNASSCSDAARTGRERGIGFADDPVRRGAG